MFDNKGRFLIKDYNKQSPFSSFLPGISGLKGIPIWCFYVNRGQAIASFGSEDKNNSIMEFYPAHQAYQFTKTMGFRTFLKVDGVFYEPFAGNEIRADMYIGMNELEIEEYNEKLGVQVNVLYYTLPNEKLGGLVRKVTIKNKQNTNRSIEVIDGMPAIIPYGIELKALKEMAQTMKAWMQVEDVERNLPYYRVRYSTKDSTKVSRIEEGNFYLAITNEGESLSIVADPEIIFSYDTSYQMPQSFVKNDSKKLLQKRQNLQNQIPSAFSIYENEINQMEAFSIYSVIGQAKNKDVYADFAKRCLCMNYFEEKYNEAIHLTNVITNPIATRTGNKIFDEYCRQTYLDNVLRGGSPTLLGNNHVFYVYSRKHGDIERDYNFFLMLAQYYSQGNGNYRDVNQNRRSDVRFAPFVKDYNIKTFYNLIQLDGFNPLVVKQVTYQLEEIEDILSFVEVSKRSLLTTFFEKEFSPGELLWFLEQEDIHITISESEFLTKVMDGCIQQQNADFTEGYWVDHWTYNLDLIEAYVSIYPEKEKNLLLEEEVYSYFESKAIVLPRHQRYVETENGIRQYHSIDETLKNKVNHKQARTHHGNGEEFYSTLFIKLLVTIQNRFASLDMYGMGVEMEAGKPGWYDALNGLPAMFGASMAETYELKRLLHYVKHIMNKYKQDIEVFCELYVFIMKTKEILQQFKNDVHTKLWVWDQLNCLKEDYRDKTTWGIDGKKKLFKVDELQEIVESYLDYINDGITLMMNQANGICPTYYYYDILEYKKNGDYIIPVSVKQKVMPLFLEGPVRYLKLPKTKKEKQELYHKVKQSNLYDKKLQMYKVNESLQSTSYEIGRAKAFSAGWLENESIWLHMEYKYLLAMLKNELYEEFAKDFYQACIPFLDYESYGRSLLENSSFIVSSANDNEAIHGKGFVARLSGSTAEFLEIWQIMMFGKRPFQLLEGEVICKFEPFIPDYLIGKDKRVEATFLGSVKVIYQINVSDRLVPNESLISEIEVVYKAGNKKFFHGYVEGETALDIRNGMVDLITCKIEKSISH